MYNSNAHHFDLNLAGVGALTDFARPGGDGLSGYTRTRAFPALGQHGGMADRLQIVFECMAALCRGKHLAHHLEGIPQALSREHQLEETHPAGWRLQLLGARHAQLGSHCTGQHQSGDLQQRRFDGDLSISERILLLTTLNSSEEIRRRLHVSPRAWVIASEVVVVLRSDTAAIALDQNGTYYF